MGSNTRLTRDLAASAGALTYRAIVDRYGERALRTAAGNRDVTRLLPGVFVAAEHAKSNITRARAALAWLPGEPVLTGASALAVWSVVERQPPKVDVRVPTGMSRAHPAWLRPFRPTIPIDTCKWECGSIARPEFAAIHAFHRSAPGMGAAWVFAAIAAGATTDGIARAASLTPRLRRRHELVGIIESAAHGSESFLEYLAAHRVFTGPSFARLVRQHRFTTRLGSYRLDLYDPLTRTAVELDGFAFHGENSSSAP